MERDGQVPRDGAGQQPERRVSLFEWEDPVTGLPGPAFWKRILANESARAERYHRPVTVALAEIVGLDTLARSWGDDLATQLTVSIARTLRKSVRMSDYLCRLAAPRFGMILTETDEIAAINFIDRVRERCQRELSGVPEGVSVTFGWASPSGGKLLEAAEEADKRLRASLGTEQSHEVSLG